MEVTLRIRWNAITGLYHAHVVSGVFAPDGKRRILHLPAKLAADPDRSKLISAGLSHLREFGMTALWEEADPVTK